MSELPDDPRDLPEAPPLIGQRVIVRMGMPDLVIPVAEPREVQWVPDGYPQEFIDRDGRPMRVVAVSGKPCKECVATISIRPFGDFRQ